MLSNYCIDGLVQDCSNSIANALALLQSCTKPLVCGFKFQLILFQWVIIGLGNVKA